MTKRFQVSAALLLAAFLVVPSAVSQTVRWTSDSDGNRIQVRIDGDIEYAPDYRSVRSMSSGAYIRIQREEGRRDWRLEVEREGSDIVYDFRRNGDRIPFESAREEIGDLILYVVRETGAHAEERVAQMLRSGGPAAVFAEVDLIRSSGASARYLRELMEQAELSDPDLQRWAEMTVSEVPSSGDRARLLIGAADEFQGTRIEEVWFKAAGTIPSSGDRARTLLAGLDAGMHASNVFGAAAGIPSSGDRTRVLIKALEGDLSADDLVQLLGAAESIPSSGDKSRVLMAASAKVAPLPSTHDAFFRAARSVASSGDRTRVLLFMIENLEMSSESWMELLQTVRTIPSSGDKARILLAASGHVEGEAMEKAYLDAAETIPSSGDRSRVLMALMRDSG